MYHLKLLLIFCIAAVLSYRKEHGPPKPIKERVRETVTVREKERKDEGGGGTLKAAVTDEDDESDPYCSLFSDE